MAVEPHAIDVIERDDVIFNFMVLLCIYKCMKVDKFWHLHFGMGAVHNTIQVVCYEFEIYDYQRFYGGIGILLLDKQYVIIGTTSFFLALRTM